VMVELNPAPKETIDLLERIHRLEEEVRQLKDDFSAFAGIQQSLKVDAEEMTMHVAKEISQDRKRITTLEGWFEEVSKPKIQHRQHNQIATLNMLLVAAYPQWRSAQDIREKMKLSKYEFSRLLRLAPDIETKCDRSDKRKKLFRRKVKV